MALACVFDCRYAESVNSRVLGIGMIVLAWGRPLPAQGQRFSFDASLHTSEKPYVQATGDGSISAKPDQALIEIGVVSQGATAVIAVAQNAKQTDSVLADLASLPGGSRKLKTTNYSVRPTYQYPKPGAAAAITGYTATNIVEVTLDDLAQVSKVIDSATKSGANVIQKLQYRLKNPALVRGQALRAAAEEAKANAEAIAAGLGLKVIRVLSAEEVTSEEGLGMYKKMPPPPPPGTVPATPMEVGAIEVSVNVIVRVEIGQ
jgi:uncharacterized protein YggE